MGVGDTVGVGGSSACMMLERMHGTVGMVGTGVGSWSVGSLNRIRIS